VNEIYGFPARAETLNRAEFLERIPFHPDDRPRVLAEVNKHDWNDRNLQEIQCRIVPRPASRAGFHSRAKVVRVPRAAGAGAWAWSPISRAQLAEQELRDSRERYARALDVAVEGHMDWYRRRKSTLSPIRPRES